MKQDWIENNIIILSKQTLDAFLKEKSPSDLIGLYTFYYYTAKWQKTNVTKCSTSYVAKGLKWTKERVIRSKKRLIEMGLIEDVKRKNKKGQFTGWYIKVNYIWKKETVGSLQNQRVAEPETGLDQRVANPDTNALSVNSLNALSANNMSAKADGWNFNKKLEAMGKDKRKHIRIIALYWKYKHYKFDNQEQYESALKRDMRAASNLKGYSPPRITEVMDWLDENVDFRWTLETVWKFIDDDLSELAPIKKTNKYQRYVPTT